MLTEAILLSASILNNIEIIKEEIFRKLARPITLLKGVGFLANANT